MVVTFGSFQSALRFVHRAPLHSNMPQSRRMFSFAYTEDVQSSKRKGKKKECEARRREWHLHTQLSVCLWASRATLSRSLPPSSSPSLLSCLVFRLWNLRQDTAPGDERRRGQRGGDEKQRLGKTTGWRCGGCWRDFIWGEITSFSDILQDKIAKSSRGTIRKGSLCFEEELFCTTHELRVNNPATVM